MKVIRVCELEVGKVMSARLSGGTVFIFRDSADSLVELHNSVGDYYIDGLSLRGVELDSFHRVLELLDIETRKLKV